MDASDLLNFVRESNTIEGILKTKPSEVEAHHRFLEEPISIDSIIQLVKVLQPDARFRNLAHVPGVRVGNHIAPPSGKNIKVELENILTIFDPFEQHIAYETLHPFTDGNGRSGRAIWLHRHVNEEGLDAYAARRGFLHSWYYHSLSFARWKGIGL